MTIRIAALVLAGLAGASVPAGAQEFTAGIRGGVTFPAGAYGDSSASLSTGWNLGVVGRVDLGSHLGIQLDVGYSANPIDGPPGGTVSDWQAGAGMVYSILSRTASFRPYVLLGLGVDYWQDNSGNGLTPAVYGSAGFDVPLDPIRPYVEMQYRDVFSPGSNLRTLQLIFGLRYVLGYR